MKVCPECRREYDDEAVACADDGMELVPAPENLPGNPHLREVQQVSPTDHTAVIDLEAIEAERERRGIARPPEPEPEPEAPEADEEEERADPDRTGTLHLDQMGSSGDMASPEGDAGESVEKTEITRQAPPGMGDKTEAARLPLERRPKRAGLPPLALGGIVLGAVLLAGGLVSGAMFYLAKKQAVLTVTSVPPGATVLVDGKRVGSAPVQTRVAPGNHVVELELAGYRPFKEVVDVPAEGMPFLQPLERDPNAPVSEADDAGPSAEADAGSDALENPPHEVPAGLTADALLAEFDELLAAGDFDGALAKVKELIRHHPDDPRGDALFGRLADARVKAASAPTEKRPRRDKKKQAREAFAEGEALYREGAVVDARGKLQAAVQLDSRFASPHRSLARIYEREGNVAKARYHLERYLRLGGPDPDYRVQRWLEDNPAR